jgi:ABC-type multidrug transport system ATPase subunit
VAVDGISFDVAAGEIFAFLGPNGAGQDHHDSRC